MIEVMWAASAHGSRISSDIGPITYLYLKCNAAHIYIYIYIYIYFFYYLLLLK